MPSISPGSVLVADPASFLKANGAAYIRVGSIAMATYDYVLTLPAEWRFYNGQRGRRLSYGCILFILIRYLSIIVIVVSNLGYFGNFTEAACERYYLVSPVFKVLQAMVSHIIIGLRTYVLSRRNQYVKWSLIVLYVVCTSLEWFTNLWNRTPVQQVTFSIRRSSNCLPGNNPHRLCVWLFYVCVMTYDTATLAASVFYMIPWRRGLRISSMLRIMLFDGIGYFIVLTGINIFNLILYRTTDELYQSSGASFAYAITWIMSQRIVIHLRDAAVGRMQSRDLLPFPLAPPSEGTTIQKLNSVIDAMADEFSVESDPTTIQHYDGPVFARKDPDSPVTDAESVVEETRSSFDARLPV